MIFESVFNAKQALFTYSIPELMEMENEGRLETRTTRKENVRKLRSYITDNYSTGDIYLPPLVASCQEGELEGKPTQLVIIDGNHRLKAFLQLETYILRGMSSVNDVEYSEAINLRRVLDTIEVPFQIFEGLSIEEVNQLYIDHNRKGKKVGLSKRIAYDSRDKINVVTNRVLHANGQLKEAGVEQEKNAVMRPANKNLISLAQLRQLVELFIKEIDTGQKTKTDVDSLREEEYCIALVNSWFEELFMLYPAKSIGNFHESMLANFPLLFAVASFTVDSIGGLAFEDQMKTVQRRMRNLSTINWERDQDFWTRFEGDVKGREAYFFLDASKSNRKALIDWLQQKGGE